MNLKIHPIVVGLGYGDEGKGATVDYLAATISDAVAVARFSGGGQAAHNVQHGPRHHTFRQFGSGSLLDLPTLLLDRVIVDPIQLDHEAHQLAAIGVHDPLRLVTVDARCRIVTPIHRALNRARELRRGRARHGSTGLGIGEAVAMNLAQENALSRGDQVGNLDLHADPPARSLLAATLTDRAQTVQALDELAAYAAPLLDGFDDQDAEIGSVAEIADALCAVARQVRIQDFGMLPFEQIESGTVIFEGAQGMLLDEVDGFHPHTTWSRVAPDQLTAQLCAAGHAARIIGVTRTYGTRHGAGPMPGEEPLLDLPERHNGEGRWQGGWRRGHLDLVALGYAAQAVGHLDEVAVTHVDAIGADRLRVVTDWGVDFPDFAPPKIAPSPLAEPPTARTELAFAAERSAVTEPAPTTTDGMIELIAATTGAPVTIISDGPNRTDRRKVS